MPVAAVIPPATNSAVEMLPRPRAWLARSFAICAEVTSGHVVEPPHTSFASFHFSFARTPAPAPRASATPLTTSVATAARLRRFGRGLDRMLLDASPVPAPAVAPVVVVVVPPIPVGGGFVGVATGGGVDRWRRDLDHAALEPDRPDRDDDRAALVAHLGLRDPVGEALRAHADRVAPEVNQHQAVISHGALHASGAPFNVIAGEAQLRIELDLQLRDARLELLDLLRRRRLARRVRVLRGELAVDGEGRRELALRLAALRDVEARTERRLETLALLERGARVGPLFGLEQLAALLEGIVGGARGDDAHTEQDDGDATGGSHRCPPGWASSSDPVFVAPVPGFVVVPVFVVVVPVVFVVVPVGAAFVVAEPVAAEPAVGAADAVAFEPVSDAVGLGASGADVGVAIAVGSTAGGGDGAGGGVVDAPDGAGGVVVDGPDGVVDVDVDVAAAGTADELLRDTMTALAMPIATPPATRPPITPRMRRGRSLPSSVPLAVRSVVGVDVTAGGIVSGGIVLPRSTAAMPPARVAPLAVNGARAAASSATFWKRRADPSRGSGTQSRRAGSEHVRQRRSRVHRDRQRELRDALADQRLAYAFRIIGAPANVEFNCATVGIARGRRREELLEYSKLGSKIRIIGASE